MMPPSPEFLLTALIVALIPGTGVLYTVSTGLFRGWRASVAAALGCTVGIVPHLLASVLGLAALLHMSALAFQAVKFAGVAYLFYLAWGMWRETGAWRLESSDTAGSLKQVAVRGTLINILNPKLSIFFLAFMPQFISPAAGSAMAQMLVLSAAFMAITFAVFVGYGALCHVVRARVLESPRFVANLKRGFAAAFAGLGLKLATTER